MSALLDLAARVQAASGADVELAALIRCAVFARDGAYVKQSPINGMWCIYEAGHNGRERSWEPRDLSREQRLGDFTTSIDSAMSLVPEGWRTSQASENVDGDGWHWRLGRKPDCAPRFGMPGVDGYAATPALALTAAALRARAGGAA